MRTDEMLKVQDMHDELCAEIGRLRAALTEIADHSSIMSDWPHTTKAMQKIARHALDRRVGG